MINEEQKKIYRLSVPITNLIDRGRWEVKSRAPHTCPSQKCSHPRNKDNTKKLPYFFGGDLCFLEGANLYEKMRHQRRIWTFLWLRAQHPFEKPSPPWKLFALWVAGQRANNRKIPKPNWLSCKWFSFLLFESSGTKLLSPKIRVVPIHFCLLPISGMNGRERERGRHYIVFSTPMGPINYQFKSIHTWFISVV